MWNFHYFSAWFLFFKIRDFFLDSKLFTSIQKKTSAYYQIKKLIILGFLTFFSHHTWLCELNSLSNRLIHHAMIVFFYHMFPFRLIECGTRITWLPTWPHLLPCSNFPTPLNHLMNYLKAQTQLPTDELIMTLSKCFESYPIIVYRSGTYASLKCSIIFFRGWPEVPFSYLMNGFIHDDAGGWIASNRRKHFFMWALE